VFIIPFVCRIIPLLDVVTSASKLRDTAVDVPAPRLVAEVGHCHPCARVFDEAFDYFLVLAHFFVLLAFINSEIFTAWLTPSDLHISRSWCLVSGVTMM
jgi:hypothetical protein